MAAADEQTIVGERSWNQWISARWQLVGAVTTTATQTLAMLTRSVTNKLQRPSQEKVVSTTKLTSMKEKQPQELDKMSLTERFIQKMPPSTRTDQQQIVLFVTSISCLTKIKQRQRRQQIKIWRLQTMVATQKLAKIACMIAVAPLRRRIVSIVRP